MNELITPLRLFQQLVDPSVEDCGFPDESPILPLLCPLPDALLLPLHVLVVPPVALLLQEIGNIRRVRVERCAEQGQEHVRLHVLDGTE